MKRLILAVAAALVVALAVQPVALADYVDDNGNIVHWAGGDNIVVTDKDGNVVYVGEGTRRDDGRLLWSGSGSNYSPPKLDSTYSGALGLRGERLPDGDGGSNGSNSQDGSSSTSPYEGTAYAGMQPVTVTVGGQTFTGYANVYDNASGGFSAIPVTSDIGKLLAESGFEVKDGMVLIHNGAEGATVGWTGGPTGPSYNNVSNISYTWGSGGTITIDVSPPGGGSYSAPAASTSYAPSYGPDTRKLVGYPEWPVVPVGKAVPLVAEVTGSAKQVQAYSAWGGSAVLEKQPDGKFRGLLQVPINVRPGVYPLTFEARIGQSGYAESLFSVTGMLTVRGSTDTSTGGGTAPADEPDWWTPPWLQGR